MDRRLKWVITDAGIVVVLIVAFAIVMFNPYKGSILIAGDQAVTEDQVRQKLQSDGWTNIRIGRDGRYFQVVASMNGRDKNFEVDSQSGRLRPDDGDDD